MHVVVCLKQILDPELPPRDFRLDPETGRVREDNTVRVISPFDENALELALQLKDQHPGVNVTAISLGDHTAEEALRRALALKVDQAILVLGAHFDGLDAYGTATVLAAAIRRLGTVELVLCGRQAGDWEQGQVSAMLAEALAVTFVPFAFSIRMAEPGLQVAREIAGGSERVDLSPPAVVSVTNHKANQLRLPKTKDLLLARHQPVRTWSVSDLGLASLPPRVVLMRMSLPRTVETVCEWIVADAPAAQAERLAAVLVERGLLEGKT